MLRLKVFALALLATTAWSPLARADDHPLKGVALVIGESDYATLHKLDNPKRDARAMDSELACSGASYARRGSGDHNRLRHPLDRSCRSTGELPHQSCWSKKRALACQGIPRRCSE